MLDVSTIHEADAVVYCCCKGIRKEISYLIGERFYTFPVLDYVIL